MKLRALTIGSLCTVSVLVIMHASTFISSSSSAQAGGRKPKLILQITVDGLRGDLPMRFKDRLGKGGFRYLLERGAHYRNAHYGHSNTETVVGHTSLATGTYPSRHGMVANVWFDRKQGKLIYNLEDDKFPILGTKPKTSVEIDPTQKVSKVQGRSPRSILASTFSDELVVSNGGQSRAFAVSVKDRGAVSLGGHAGKAFWYSKKTGEFVTSEYYYKDYPQWVKAWNARRAADAYKGKSWKLLNDKSTYVFGAADDRPWETDVEGYGRTFPHRFGDGKYFYTFLTFSPVGDALTLDFAKTLVEAEKLGQGKVTDYLSISFSSTDYVGHVFSPSSLETEDNLLRLDRTLAELFKFVDDKVGLDNTLIVLSADHGAPEAPEYMASLGMKTGRISPKRIDTKTVFDSLKKQFGVGKELIKLYYHPYIYLDLELIKSKRLDQAKVERALAKELMKVPGIAMAVASSDLVSGNLPDLPVIQQIRRNFHRNRSGDIYMVQEQYWWMYTTEDPPTAAMHGSPWAYDTYVPVFFAGGGVTAQTIYRRMSPYDIAATLSARLGIKPPSGSVGTPLVEVLREK